MQTPMEEPSSVCLSLTPPFKHHTHYKSILLTTHYPHVSHHRDQVTYGIRHIDVRSPKRTVYEPLYARPLLCMTFTMHNPYYTRSSLYLTGQSLYIALTISTVTIHDPHRPGEETIAITSPDKSHGGGEVGDCLT